MVQYTLMSETTTTAVRTASKDILARAMAMEDIRVEHRADAPTAYFDTKNRVLGLPVWKDMDNSIYDMLVGHEVSHALNTPADGWQEFVNGNGTRLMFLNIVEDARIERMIKDKFPGLKRDFASAYGKLHKQDLFELKGRTIDLDVPLIDRLNLEFKLGLFGLEDIPFTADEQQYVTRMAETTTFEEVMALAEDLFGKHEDEKPEPEQSDDGEQGEGEPGEGGESGETDESSDSDSETGTGESGASDEDSDSDESGESESSGGDDSGDSMDDDTDDGESAESNDTDGDSGEGDDDSTDLSYESYDNEVGAAGSTQRSFEKGVEQFRDEKAKVRDYKTLVEPNLENIVVTPKQIEAEWNGYHASVEKSERAKTFAEIKSERLGDFQKFMSGSKGTVAHMVQQFQMKQAAESSKRTDIAKTGVLDTVGMMNYRWSEDIFLKNEVHSDGKSHGIVMYLDWSGSMCDILQDTVEQCIILSEFCRKAGIPFDVYAFSSNRFVPNPDNHRFYSDEYDALQKAHGEKPQWTNQERDEDGEMMGDFLSPHTFSLFHFLSSSMNARQMKTALTNLWFLTGGNSRSDRRGYGYPNGLGLGCTPLNEAIICAMTQIPEFKRQHGVDIVNCVVLSDGEGHSTGLRGYGSVGVLRDPKTNKNYECDTRTQGAETDVFLECLRQRTGASLIGIRLHPTPQIKNLRWTVAPNDDKVFEAKCAEYKKMNFTTLDGSAYDGYFLIKGNTEIVTDALDDVGADASYTRLKNAFIKGGNTKKASRVVANRIIDIIAA
jgi:hypothetical protein